MDKRTIKRGEKSMAEYEVNAHLEGEVDIDIETNKMSSGRKLALVQQILRGDKISFASIYVELEGECYVEIEPQERE